METKEAITPYPLFGKAYIEKDEIFGDWCYREPGSNCTMSPVIGSAISTEDNVQVYNNTPVTIFSNGSEADWWMCNNCHECKRMKPVSNPLELRNGGCPLEYRIAIAAMHDGTIPFKAAKRIGFENLSIQRHGLFAHLSSCKEKI